MDLDNLNVTMGQLGVDARHLEVNLAQIDFGHLITCEIKHDHVHATWRDNTCHGVITLV